MKRLNLIIAITAGAFTIAATAAAEETRAPTKGEIKLSKMLEGRVAGEPVSCISTFPRMDLEVIDGTALVYKRGSTIWVNIPSNAKYIDRRHALLTRNTQTRLCKQDIMRAVDSSTGTPRGTINLSQFVPYRKGS